MKTNTLPDKPSELIRVALKDLRECEADPLYTVDMAEWHKLYAQTCHVCLAGAVMAKSLNSPRESTTPGDLLAFLMDKDEISWNERVLILAKLRALDHFRVGSVECGLEQLGIPRPKTIPEYLSVKAYCTANEGLIIGNGFYSSMEQMALMLEQAGL